MITALVVVGWACLVVGGVLVAVDSRRRRKAPPSLAEKIVTEAIVEHLELCGWRLEHRPKTTVTAARCSFINGARVCTGSAIPGCETDPAILGVVGVPGAHAGDTPTPLGRASFDTRTRAIWESRFRISATEL